MARLNPSQASLMLAQLKLLIQAGNPLISIVSHDEEGVTEGVRWSRSQLGLPLFEWTITTGMMQTMPSKADIGVKPGKAVPALEYIIDNNGKKEIYFLKDLGPHCKDAFVQRQLREIYLKRKVSVILFDLEPLPETIRRLAVALEMPLPSAEELEKVIRETFKEIHSASYEEITSAVTKKDIEQMAQTLRGLTKAEAARVIAAAIHDDNALTPKDLPRIVEDKRNLLKSAGCLEAIGVNVAVDEIGGLDNLKRWLAKRRGATSRPGPRVRPATRRGASCCWACRAAARACVPRRSRPTGRCRCCGWTPACCTRSTSARARSGCARRWRRPRRWRPVVLWIDEIEKAFASAASTSADGGLSQRMFGTLLSWMQDHRSPIFIVATANDIEALPPELMRKGRFDEVFFVDLPNRDARRTILEIHLQPSEPRSARFASTRSRPRPRGSAGRSWSS